jgi:beta-aspartyl-peptidase (threonine type)
MRRHAAPAIAVHGGAGELPPDDALRTGDQASARRDGVLRACSAGAEVLRSGGSAVDAVEAAVRVLEDDPVFNAATGAVLTTAGEAELDASIMDGATLRCGGVAAVKDVRNPVSLARAVMERSRHVLLAGDGASAFARSVGIPAHDNALLVTPRQRARWEAALHGGPASRLGTVGAVARDAAGHVAAATSTGGMSMKLPGRVGDSPLIGCGTYADDALAAVSCTGHGERIIQVTLARHAADLVGRGRSPAEAAREAIETLGARVAGDGGLILVAPAGEVGIAYNTPGMSRAWTDPDGTIRCGL